MPVALYAAWSPDSYELNDPGAAGEASGVFPGRKSKRPWPQLAAVSEALDFVPGVEPPPEEPPSLDFSKPDNSQYLGAGLV
jgi:hypothetical protein